MFRPVPMVKISIVLLDTHRNALTTALGTAGFIHLTSAPPESEGGLLARFTCDAELRARADDLAFSRQLLEKLGLPPGSPTLETAAFPAADRIEGLLRDIDRACTSERAALDALTDETVVLQGRIRQLETFPLQDVRLDELRTPRHLFVGVGSLPESAIPGLAPKLENLALLAIGPVRADDLLPVAVVAARRHRFQLESLLKKAGFTPIEIPPGVAGTALAERGEAESRLQMVEGLVAENRTRIQALAERHGPLVTARIHGLETRLAELHAQELFGQSRRLQCITGWLPAEKEPEACRIAAEVSNGGALVSVTRAEQDKRVKAGRDKVPVQFGGSVLLKPFQALVSAYGIPRYDEVEPSLFVAITFVLMFGLMFGDVGHGAVLGLAGVYLLLSRRPAIRAIRPAGYLLLFCGLAAVLFGLAYGSVFGREDLLPALWLSPLEETTTLFACAIGFGIACISIALVFNLINKFRARDYFNGLLDKTGLAGACLYWGVLALGLTIALGGRIPSWVIVLVVLVPLLFLFLREPLLYLREKRHGSTAGSLPMSLLTSFIETMDTLSTFFSNTMSFVRVGAFALSHAALCMAVYAISDLLREGSGGRVLSPLFIILGNLFVIGMEGMLVLIQITRLQFYELFAKYFSGDGIAYAPFQLGHHLTQGERR